MTPYYTNSTNLPVNFSDDPWEAIKHQEDIQKLYTGGTTFHTYINESVYDWKKLKEFVKKVMYNSTLPYITVTPTFSHCQIHGFIVGNTGGVCPKCKEEAVASYQKRLTELQQKKEEMLKESEDNSACVECEK
jgi:ribonucleoside-triphosphate reductase